MNVCRGCAAVCGGKALLAGQGRLEGKKWTTAASAAPALLVRTKWPPRLAPKSSSSCPEQT